MTPPRISKDEYYLGIAREVARRSTCFRRSIGAIIVRDDQIISTGYVGAPRKTRDSVEHGFCLRDRLGIPHGQRYELCRSVHAEQNAIINAARAGVSLLGGDMYIFGTAADRRSRHQRLSLLHLQEDDHQRRLEPHRLLDGRRDALDLHGRRMDQGLARRRHPG